MAVNINRVLLAGNLTRDPQVKFFANERAVADFGIAVNRRFKGADGNMKEETTFVDVEAWGRTAELVGQYLTKGRGCFVEGRLRLDQWEDKNTGGKRSKLKVIADTVTFLDGPRGSGEGEHQASAPASSPAPAAPPMQDSQPSYDDDEPPF